MVKFDNLSQNADDESAVLSIILISISMLSLVITVMGIKLRWFRHRLTLEQPETQSDSPVLLRTTSITEFRENCSRGVYRQSSGEDASLVPYNSPPVSLNGVTKAKITSERHSIFRMPFRSKLNLSRNSSRDDTQVTTVQQAAPTSTPKHHDYATIHKNEHLKRMIHEELQKRNSVSMPDLLNRQDLSPTQYRERSVDEEVKELDVTVLQEKKIQEHSEKSIPSVEAPLESSEEKQIDEEVFQKRVKFEEVNEIEENVFESQFEKDIGEGSTDDEKYSTPPPTPYYVQEFEEYDLPPPTPMRRKSRENSFNKPAPSVTLQIEAVDETNNVLEPPVVKPRTKRLAYQDSDFGKDDIDSVTEIKTLQQEIQKAAKYPPPIDSKEPQKLEKNSFDIIETFENDVHEEVEPYVIEAAPKSILRSSETSSNQKTITFHDMPESISYDEISSSSSDSEEEDVWSKVNMHRYHLSRHNDEQLDNPPPLPKTPPPSEQDERHFSFA